MARSRFAAPLLASRIKGIKPRIPPPKPKPSWRLEDSIWAPRVKWSDSKDFWDSEAAERKLFDLDWKRALDCGVGRFILRMDDGDDEAEIDEVNAVLWEFHDLLFTAFDYYSAQGTSMDITHMTTNGFTMFVQDCNLSDQKSKSYRPADYDRLFVSVDATTGKAADEKHNRKKALNRQEFWQCLVQMACMRYIASGEMIDVSDAVHRMCSENIEANLDTERVFVEPNVFRDKYTYIEEADAALRKYEDTLRRIFTRTTTICGQNASKGIGNKMVGVDSWKAFCRGFGLVDDGDLSERDAILAFTWSRTRVIDEQSDRGHIKLTYLSFEDFLEALVRCCVLKSWPTPEEIEASGAGSAGRHLNRLKRDDPEAYSELMQERAVNWGAAPLQPIEVCIECMCSLLIVTCQESLAGPGKGNGTSLTEKDINKFLPVVVA